MKTHLEPIGLSSAPCHLKPLQAFLSICLMLPLHLSPSTHLFLVYSSVNFSTFPLVIFFIFTQHQSISASGFSSAFPSLLFIYFWSFCHILHFITLACTRLGCMAAKYGFSATEKSSECERGTFLSYILTQKDCVCICLCVVLAKSPLNNQTFTSVCSLCSNSTLFKMVASAKQSH